MKSYLDCWIEAASSLFPQALAGAPVLAETLPKPMTGPPVGYTAYLNGTITGEFTVVLDGDLLDASLMGDGIDQSVGWQELLREVAEAAAGEWLAATGNPCRVEKFEAGGTANPASRVLELNGGEHTWLFFLRDRTHTEASPGTAKLCEKTVTPDVSPATRAAISGATEHGFPGLDLLLDVELEASLRFGSRELPLGDILELGPGDVVQLDRQVADPVDLIVADKIVARGEVVLVNGYFGLRVTEVAAPIRRLETIRCLF